MDEPSGCSGVICSIVFNIYPWPLKFKFNFHVCLWKTEFSASGIGSVRSFGSLQQTQNSKCRFSLWNVTHVCFCNLFCAVVVTHPDDLPSFRLKQSGVIERATCPADEVPETWGSHHNYRSTTTRPVYGVSRHPLLLTEGLSCR